MDCGVIGERPKSTKLADNSEGSRRADNGTHRHRGAGSVLVGSGQTREAFIAEAKFLLAVKLFELGRLSSSRAADVSGMNRVDFLLRAGQSGTPVTDLDERKAEEFSSPAFPSGEPRL